jgi:dTDP-4-dehydrorhamnose reductase
LNTDLPGELALACTRLGIKMVHISTDAVFDGEGGGYSEEDQVNPLSVYARSKLKGEERVRAANADALIARVNFYGWSLTGKRSLAEWFVQNLSDGKSVNGFTDVYFCPLEVHDLVDTLLEMVNMHLNGTYHVVSREYWSKFEFGIAIATRFGFDSTLIHPVSWKDGGLKAARSPRLILDCSKLENALGHPIAGQQSGLERFYQSFKTGLPQRLKELAGDNA